MPSIYWDIYGTAEQLAEKVSFVGARDLQGLKPG